MATDNKIDNESFIDALANHRARLSEYEDYVDQWHQQDPSNHVPLHTFLGLTWDEYKMCAVNVEAMHDIAMSRQKSR